MKACFATAIWALRPTAKKSGEEVGKPGIIGRWAQSSRASACTRGKGSSRYDFYVAADNFGGAGGQDASGQSRRGDRGLRGCSGDA